MEKVKAKYDLLILGLGAAAHGAALYAARYQMSLAMFGGEFGGETASGSVIENYPGYLHIDGYELMLKMREQVEALNVPLVPENVAELRREGDCFFVRAGQDWYQGQAVVYAVGRERRQLGIPREREFIGKGISYCSTCDAPLYKGKRAGVVGGGDSALKGALLLAKYATQVYIIYRGAAFVRPEPIAVQRAQKTSNLAVLFETSVVQLKGHNGLAAVVLDRPVNGSLELALDGLFVEIGADPRTRLLEPFGAQLNEKGEVVVDKLMRTSVPGIFGAGDVTDASGDLKQTVTAVAQGATAATSAYKYVAAYPDACQYHARAFELAYGAR